MVKKILSRLPENILKALHILRERYSDDRFNKEGSRGEIRGYLKGLKDAGVINTDTEYRALFSYLTI